ncbi:hypothetical protein C2857_000272 [Epichloe festucae Fl1]|uniref:Fe2OG dioxygenase domain-containing protein n=1 Tax=Epichloe festucae (strain Fl1) TaxID=877507 RepID=A0A7U3Q1A9_EPIFF|nr:hypothetical protein C2857_000272 [Epichloe festucae Fl1]
MQEGARDGKPSGLSMQTEFLTAQHEEELVDMLSNRPDWPPALPGRRRSLHYGYTFSYKTFGIDEDVPFRPFPEWLRGILPREPNERRDPDQVCVQHYPPGAGIPPHVDTHGAYGDELYALSLGSPVVMQFRDGHRRSPDGAARADVDLPARSMLRMGGEARLHWTHGIRARKTDTLADGTVRPRRHRWSVTYRWLREGAACACGDEELCDTARRRRGLGREYRWEREEEAAARARDGS